MPETYDPNHYEYHYKREERVDLQSEWLKKRSIKKTFFERYRNFLVIFFDILLITFIFLMIVHFTGFGSPEAGGFHLKGRAFYYDGEILASLTLSPKKDFEGGATDMVMELSLSEAFDDVLMNRTVIKGDTEQVLRMNIQTETPGKHVYMRITIGKESRILKIPLAKE